MTSMSTPPAGQTPPPLHYPGAAGERVGHRLRAGVVVGIMLLVILVVAGVVAAVVLSGTSSHPKPPQPGQSGGLAGASSQPGTVHGSINTPGTIGPAEPSTPGTDAPTAPATPAAGTFSTGAVSVGDGITLTPAPGWSVESQSKDDRTVTLINADTSAEMFVAVGKASGTDIAQVLSTDITNATSGAAFSNVKLSGQPSQKTRQSDRFQQERGVGYTADLQTQQGTIPVVGVFAELLNTSTRESAFIDVHAVSSDALKQAAEDADAMIGSML
jgi:hypothetical protein